MNRVVSCCLVPKLLLRTRILAVYYEAVYIIWISQYALLEWEAISGKCITIYMKVYTDFYILSLATVLAVQDMVLGVPRLANGTAHPPGITCDTKATGCPGSGWMTGDPVFCPALSLLPTLLIHSPVFVEISLYPGSLTKGTLSLLRTVLLLKANKNKR